MKLLALLLLSSVASAGQAVLTITPPTLNTDGSTIIGQITYNVYKGAQGQAVKPLLVTGLTATTYTALNLTAGTTTCFNVTANVVGETESAYSNEVCKTIPPTNPNPPTITIAGNVYQSKPSGALALCGKIDLGVTCGPDAHLKAGGRELYAVPRYKVSFTRKDWGSQTLGVCA